MEYDYEATMEELRMAAKILRKQATEYQNPILEDIAGVCENAVETLCYLAHSEAIMFQRAAFIWERDRELYEQMIQIRCEEE